MAVSRTYEVDIEITPDELAEAFTEMDSEQQAQFFSKIWQIAKAWPGAGWCQQSCDIVRCLDHDGKEAVNALAEHLALAGTPPAGPSEEQDDRPEWELRTGFREEDFA